MRVSDFDFDLPTDRIALRPAIPRDSARLLAVRADGTLEDHRVHDLPGLLRRGDVMVFNDTKVIPARLSGVRDRHGSTVQVQATLLKRLSGDRWTALMKPGKRLRPGDRVRFGERLDGLEATVEAKGEDGAITLAFDRSDAALDEAIARLGAMPLPPYIAALRPGDKRDRLDYQTVYAREEGSVAAPTAGLHFTPELLARLEAMGIGRAFVTLHVGAGTFLPVKVDAIADHKMHAETGEISAETAATLNAARAAGGRIVCVGTTSLRLLESATGEDGVMRPFAGETAIFITPGYRFRAADLLMTNFHLPKSTLLMLVCAFSGMASMRAAYAHAIGEGYRFYSYGDAGLWERASSPLQSGGGGSAQPAETERARSSAAPSPAPSIPSGSPPPRVAGEAKVSCHFHIAATDGAARTGVLKTPRGDIHTPAFMPVGTAGTVKALTVDQVRQTGADIILGNTYHLMLRPGAERVARLGGLHKFMRWDGPILTDSGGFQVMSLGQISKVTEAAVTFQSHLDGSRHVLSPERSIEIQADLLGADIVMQLDQCVSWPAEESAAREAMDLSIRWGARSKAAFGTRDRQVLFGIQQGSTFEHLRRESADRLIDIGFDGYAIGGLAVGEGHKAMCDTLDFAASMLPADRPRYLMGVGKPIDLVEAVARGVDMFDCVLPTRSGRHGQAWTWDGPLNLKNARFAEDEAPLDPSSDCAASRDYSRAYLNHLIRSGEILGQVLLSWHNIAFFQALMQGLRAAIAEGRLESFRRDFRARHLGPVQAD